MVAQYVKIVSRTTPVSPQKGLHNRKNAENAADRSLRLRLSGICNQAYTMLPPLLFDKSAIPFTIKNIAIELKKMQFVI